MKTVNLKTWTNIFSATCTAVHPSILFQCELQSFGAISHRDVCLLLNIMELDGTQFVVLSAPKKYILKHQQQFVFPEIMTQLLR